jgi:Ni/Fe-hydrogenase subunit HybB-like protein
MGELIGWIFLGSVTALLIGVAVLRGLDRRPRGLRMVGWSAVAALWAVTAVVLVVRFTRGLGAVTAMTDRFPWGVWIGLLQSGVALSAGGFVLAATVHVFHLRRFEPILRPVVLLAFLGYTFVALTLFIEVGRPLNLWHPLVQWQHHSIMFEVAWCVTLYFTVLLAEFSPVIFERLRLPRAARLAHTAAIPIVIAGVILSTLHQSSMGSMFLIIPQKLHSFWYSPLLPVFFLMSSVAAGLCMTVAACFYAGRLFRAAPPSALMEDLLRFASPLLLLYGLLRLIDITARGAWVAVGHVPGLTAMLIFELGAGVIAPGILLARREVRGSERRRVLACLAVLGGVVLNRLTVSWFALTPSMGGGYRPSWMELAISLTLATAVLVAFGAGVKYLPVFSNGDGFSETNSESPARPG